VSGVNSYMGDLNCERSVQRGCCWLGSSACVKCWLGGSGVDWYIRRQGGLCRDYDFVLALGLWIVGRV